MRDAISSWVSNKGWEKMGGMIYSRILQTFCAVNNNWGENAKKNYCVLPLARGCSEAVMAGGGGGEAGSCLKVISSSSLWIIVVAVGSFLIVALWSFPFPELAEAAAMAAAAAAAAAAGLTRPPRRDRLSRLTRFLESWWLLLLVGLVEGARIGIDIERAGFWTAIIWPPLAERT